MDFSFYCVVIVIALMLFLIFYPQNGGKDNSNQNSTPNTDSSSTIEPSNPDEETPAQPSDPDDTSDPSESDDNNNPSNPSEEITYATSLTLNSPREITVSKNCELYFLDGFISVQPADATDNLSHTLTARSGIDIDNIIFSDNKIVGKGSGYYYLKYSVPMSEDETLSETIIIHIVDTTEESERKYWEERYIYFRKREVHLLGVEKEVEHKTKWTAGRASYVERNQAMINDSDICVFYYDENYKPQERKYSKHCVFTYQPKSGTALAYKYAQQKKKEIINIYSKL